MSLLSHSSILGSGHRQSPNLLKISMLSVGIPSMREIILPSIVSDCDISPHEKTLERWKETKITRNKTSTRSKIRANIFTENLVKNNVCLTKQEAIDIETKYGDSIEKSIMLTKKLLERA